MISLLITVYHFYSKTVTLPTNKRIWLSVPIEEYAKKTAITTGTAKSRVNSKTDTNYLSDDNNIITMYFNYKNRGKGKVPNNQFENNNDRNMYNRFEQN